MHEPETIQSPKESNTKTPRSRIKSIAKATLIVLLVLIIAAVVRGATVTNNAVTDAKDTIANYDPVNVGEVPATSEPAKQSQVHIGSMLEAEGIEVTPVQLMDPAKTESEYSKPAAGKHYVAVKLELVNKGSVAYEGNANNNTLIIGSDNQTYTTAFFGVKDCTNFAHGTYTLAPGASASGCVSFELPDDVAPTKIQFSPRSGFSDINLEWLAP